jgi:hypothetical protein
MCSAPLRPPRVRGTLSDGRSLPTRRPIARPAAGAAGFTCGAGPSVQRAVRDGQGEVQHTQNFAQSQEQNRLAEQQRQYQLALQRFGLDQQQLGLSQQAQDFSQYTKLADLASNPRNYVQTFFMNRGQTPPPDVARYGNTTQTAADIMPFGQWQAQHQQSSPQVSAGVSSPSRPALPTPGNPTPGYGDAYSGANHFNRDGTITLAPNDPDAPGLIAKNPGMYRAGGAQEQAFLQPPTDRLFHDRGVPMMARGGNVTMYVPHALINLATGKTVAIAGEAGRETAHFDGAAIIDPYTQCPTVSAARPVLRRSGPDRPEQPLLGNVRPVREHDRPRVHRAVGSGNDQFVPQPAPQYAPMAPLTSNLPNTSTGRSDAAALPALPRSAGADPGVDRADERRERRAHSDNWRNTSPTAPGASTGPAPEFVRLPFPCKPVPLPFQTNPAPLPTNTPTTTLDAVTPGADVGSGVVRRPDPVSDADVPCGRELPSRESDHLGRSQPPVHAAHLRTGARRSELRDERPTAKRPSAGPAAHLEPRMGAARTVGTAGVPLVRLIARASIRRTTSP